MDEKSENSCEDMEYRKRVDSVKTKKLSKLD